MKYPDQVAYGAYGSHALVSGNAYDLFVACETDADWIDEILDDCLRKADILVGWEETRDDKAYGSDDSIDLGDLALDEITI